MKLAYVDFCGFRGYRKRIRLDFGSRFTIIDGRNGAGKSTIFDAVEFALTGDIRKYNNASASRESVQDYIWWRGGGVQPKERFVEVGFAEGNEITSVKRTEFAGPSSALVDILSNKLCNLSISPKDPLARICARSILRDEQISELSLDLKEVERYALLRDGLGVSDADEWIERAQSLVASAKKKVDTAQAEVDRLNQDLAQAIRRVDEARLMAVEEGAIGEAAARLKERLSLSVPTEELPDAAQEALASMDARIQELESVLVLWDETARRRPEMDDLEEQVKRGVQRLEVAEAALATATRSDPPEDESPSEVARRARDLATLVELGERLGLHDGHCPLCAAEHDLASFQRGLAAAAHLASASDSRAVSLAKEEETRHELQRQVLVRKNELAELQSLFSAARKLADDLKGRLLALGTESATREDLLAQLLDLTIKRDAVRADHRVVRGVRLNTELGRLQRSAAHANERLQIAQKRAAAVRRAEQSARLLHDAARRAASEALDRRLEQVLPLMSELYRRLRPHPYWRDIEYSIRGDVRKFIRLQVGDELNPQFMFSSGQRRATGLAFLLSINLSIAWSKFQTVMLDDPVQHVDDFRTVHLAEVLSQLVRQGRQIVCSVEDSVLADLLCRRLPVAEFGSGKRVSLAPDKEGDLDMVRDESVAPMPRNVLVPSAEQAA